VPQHGCSPLAKAPIDCMITLFRKRKTFKRKIQKNWWCTAFFRFFKFSIRPIMPFCNSNLFYGSSHLTIIVSLKSCLFRHCRNASTIVISLCHQNKARTQTNPGTIHKVGLSAHFHSSSSSFLSLSLSLSYTQTDRQIDTHSLFYSSSSSSKATNQNTNWASDVACLFLFTDRRTRVIGLSHTRKRKSQKRKQNNKSNNQRKQNNKSSDKEKQNK
jgi:hypothetical protein